MKIEDVEGVGDAYAAKLRAAGVGSTDALLAAAGSARGREALAATSGIGERTLLEWVNHADLMRIRGVGSEYADLLEEAGVDSCTELAQRNSENLAARIASVNEAKRLVRRVPSVKEVAGWIRQAGDLPKVITH
jgi:predicted flap endonuclease-1-like 5' DNA nuclease